MSAEQVRQLLSTLQHLRSTASTHLLDSSPPDATAAELQSATQAVTAALGNIHAPKLPEVLQEQADALWQGGCKLWDVCVQANNRGLCQHNSPAAPAVALLRQLVCQTTALLADEQLTEEEHIYRLRFCLTAGRAWAVQQRWEAAELVLALASSHGGVFQDLLAAPPEELAPQARAQYATLLFDAALQRLAVAWELGQQELSCQLVTHCRELAEALRQQDPGAVHLHLQLAATLHTRSSKALEADLEEGEVAQVLGLLEEAFKLATEVEAAVKAVKAAPPSTTTATPSHQLLSNAAELHAKVLLTLAYCHLVHTGRVEDGLRCIAALRQMEPSAGEAVGASEHAGTAAAASAAGGVVAAAQLAGHPAVSLLALKAYVALQDLDHAEAEVTGLAVHDEADPTTCLAALLELVAAQLPLERLRPAAELVQGRFPEDPQFLASLVTSLLTTTSNSTTNATSSDPNNTANSTTAINTAPIPWEYEQLALQLLERCEGAGAALRDQGPLKQQVAAALYAAGVAHFKAKRFSLAVQLLVACLSYTEHPAPTCRVLALCQLALQDLHQALEYADLAEKHLPLQAATSFIRLKIHLLRQDTPAANAEIQHLCRCQDFDVDLLKVAAQESIGAGALSTAKAALLSLHTLLVQEATDSSGSASAVPMPAKEQGCDALDSATQHSKTPEVRVLRALVKLVNDELEAAGKAADAALDAAVPEEQTTEPAAAATGAPSVPGSLTELGRLLTTVVGRVRVLGVLRFTGASEDQQAQQELTYFANVAFNAGLAAAAAQDYQACTVLMNHCGNLLHHLSPLKSPDLLSQARLAFLLAGSAALEVHRKLPEHAGSLGLAHKMFSCSSAARGELEEAQMGRQSAGAARMHVFQCLQEAVLALRGKDTAATAAAVEQLQAAAGCTAEHLLKLCTACQQQETRDPQLAARCARLALQQLLSTAAPDVEQVAVTLRLLLTLTSRDEDKLALLTEVTQVLLSLPSAATYPPLEAAWLVSTTWNKGLTHQRFDRHALATQFMEAALQLLPLGRETYGDKEEGMAAELQRQQVLAQGQSHGQGQRVQAAV